MHETLTHIRHSHKIIPLFIANFFIALHYILVIYINSSFLKEFLSARSISALYTCGAILSFILFIFAPKLVKKVSNFKFLISIFAIEAFALLTMAFTSSVLIVVLGFLLYFITVYAIFYSMDVFLETAIKKEHHTGILRAVYLTIANLGIREFILPRPYRFCRPDFWHTHILKKSVSPKYHTSTYARQSLT